MTEEEEKAILKSFANLNEDIKLKQAIETVLNLIQKQQAEIEKKDKIIDKIEEISKNPYNMLEVNGIRFSGTEIKQYFERQVENE